MFNSNDNYEEFVYNQALINANPQYRELRREGLETTSEKFFRRLCEILKY